MSCISSRKQSTRKQEPTENAHRTATQWPSASARKVVWCQHNHPNICPKRARSNNHVDAGRGEQRWEACMYYHTSFSEHLSLAQSFAIYAWMGTPAAGARPRWRMECILGKPRISPWYLGRGSRAHCSEHSWRYPHGSRGYKWERHQRYAATRVG